MISRRSSVRRVAARALGPLAPAVRLALDAPTAAAAWRRASQLLPLQEREPRVAYLLPGFPAGPPARNGFATGGAAKMVYLAEAFPHSYPACDVLFTVSSVRHPWSTLIVRRARTRGVRVVLNQNGVHYRAWFGKGWRAANRPLSVVHRRADHVVYQSEFCRRSARLFLEPVSGTTSVLHNPVDIRHFQPAGDRPARPTLLAISFGPAQSDRVLTLMRTIAAVRRSLADAVLVIAGWDPSNEVDAAMIATVTEARRREGLDEDSLVIVPRFSRIEAPAVLQQGHALLHPVYNDASPNIVVEAMACGLPVVFSSSGGVPELVGDAGVGVPAPDDFEQYHLPDPDALAQAALEVLVAHDRLAPRARVRAESMFALDRWVESHRTIFREVISR
ncbi:MAG: glycosyltransferase family 4 protein [Gemmatimonadota bacterium]